MAENRKKKNPETVAPQRFQGFSTLARPKGLEPPTFRTGSRNPKTAVSVAALRV